VIALVNMPFGSLTRPPLALGVIAAQLKEAGLALRTYHFNLDFARILGFSAYETIALFKGAQTQVGEWLFTEAAWRVPFGPSDEEFLRRCETELVAIPHVPDRVKWLRLIKQRAIMPFLRHCLARIFAGSPPSVIAFSCMFFQTLAALALGRLVRESYPQVKLIYGGACFHGEMGCELISKIPWIDAVAVGEADDVIVLAFRELSEGRSPRGLRGLLYRNDAGQVKAGPPPVPMPPSVLNALPDPDFDDFFIAVEQVGLLTERTWQDRATVPFETSRGCFWGQKSHCAFCGLNGEGMIFRMRSAERVESCLRNLAARYPVRNLFAADNILPLQYFKSLLPRLADNPITGQNGSVDLFFEVKANLTRDQIRLLAEAGVKHIQPGIESLSTPILRKMGKGVSALQNVYLLKCCQEYGVVPYWNMLIRVPGEQPIDYLHMARWLPLLFHLRPPSGGAVRVECHRFSSYHRQASLFTESMVPASFYRSLFPVPPFELERIAYYFDAEWKDTLGEPAYESILCLVSDWLRRWRDDKLPPQLVVAEQPGGGLLIEDTRSRTSTVHHLNAVQAKLYGLLSDVTSRERFLVDGRTVCELSVEMLQSQLAAFIGQGLVLAEGESLLGLALPQNSPQVSRDHRRVQMRAMSLESSSDRSPTERSQLPIIRTEP